MCGITALLNTRGAPVDPAVLAQITRAMSHRGPDGEGYHVDRSVGLGHRRLAIIDLEGGRQPLSNEDATVWITFNGEIYNYRDLRKTLVARGHQFRTDTDTEAIVHAYEEWGTACVTHLRGMFAFAIWDGRKREMFLARDRFGIKPLVYWEKPGLFAVASEIQALRQHPDFDGSVSLPSIDLYLHYQYIPAPDTIYRNVHKLPPAHTLVVRADGSHGPPVRYWDVTFEPDRSLNESAWIERLDAALEETVSAHLVSDVPFGAFLSGGIDSSTVVGYMSRIMSTPVKSFTIAHHSAEYDERQWAEQAARICGAEHYVETVNPDALAVLPDLVRHCGEPFADSSAVATLAVAKLARRHVKMALSGDGGDEIFAGYHAYPAILREIEPTLGPFKWTKRALADALRSCKMWPPRATAADLKYARTATIPPALRATLWQSHAADYLGATREQFDCQFTARRGEGLLGRLQHHDLANYIAYDNLPKVDAASMTHSLEVRVPLLDHVFLETARQVPPELKLRADPRSTVNGNGSPGTVIGKYLLKRTAERFFPHDFLHRPKRGFEIPVRDWFGGPFAKQLTERLTGRNSRICELFHRETLQSLVREAQTDRPAAWRGWTLLVLEEWLEQAAENTRPKAHPSIPETSATCPA
ncbi:MAG: asparagine synthase (glutamine-hydrolyzing) [Planctomycetaceae bacterium]|nr:asparagine synthase (glutamine-hydrolyzing) [Planctomycetaceae bacterium]